MQKYGLKAGLRQYDTGYWVVYSQHAGHLVPSGYMVFQIEQLKVLHAITGDALFLAYTDKWSHYRGSVRSSGFLTAKGYLLDARKAFSMFERSLKALIHPQ